MEINQFKKWDIVSSSKNISQKNYYNINRTIFLYLDRNS